MRRFQIEIGRQVRKALDRLGKPDQRRVVLAIAELGTDPRPLGAKVLSGEEDFYRIRVGDYRIIYQIDGAKLIVHVLRLGHRREVYREFVRQRKCR